MFGFIRDALLHEIVQLIREYKLSDNILLGSRWWNIPLLVAYPLSSGTAHGVAAQISFRSLGASDTAKDPS